MRDRTLAYKAGAGAAALLLGALMVVFVGRCDDCDGTQAISASDGADRADQPETVAPADPPAALVVSKVPIAVPLVDDLAYGELLALGDTGFDALAPDAADPATTTTVGGQPTATDSTGSTATDSMADPSSTTGASTADPSTSADPAAVQPGSSNSGGTAAQGAGASTTANSSGPGGGQTTASSTSTTAAPTTEAPTTAAPATAPPPVDTGSVPANGQVFYVSSSSGNDSNDGLSMAKPWKSLRAALKRLSAGQTLLVMNGEYRENKAPGVAHYAVDIGGRADAWVKIGAAPGHKPTIIASNGTGLLIHVPYVEVSGLTVKGSGFNKDNNWGVGIAVTNTHHVRVVGNSISNFPVSGISATGSTNFQLIGNDVAYNSFWSPLQGSGISVWHSKNRGHGADSAGYHDRIVGNRVYGNENKVLSGFYDYATITDGNGIIVDSNQETGYTGRTLIANNVVFDNGGRGVIVWRSDRVDIMFNTAYQNGQTDGIAGGATELAAGRSNDILIANNVGWARSGLPAIIFDRVGNGSSYANVLVTDSPSGHASGRDVMHSGNPGFRNPSTNPGSADFRPTSGSVLKGRAENAAWFIGTDRVGTSRKNGTPDVGAYEAEAARP